MPVIAEELLQKTATVAYKLKTNTPASFGKGPNLLDDFQIPTWK